MSRDSEAAGEEAAGGLRPTELTVTGGDVELFVRRLGAGPEPPLVLVHGGPDWDHSYLVSAARRLAARRRVVLFDLRGCGRSGRCADLRGYSREAAAGDVIAVVEAVGPPVDLLGFSFGGRLAILAAQRRPDLFRSLVFASTSLRGRVDWSDEPPERRRRREQVPALEEVLGRTEGDGAAETRALALAGLPLDVWREERIAAVRRVVERVRFSGEWGRAWRAGLLDPGADDAHDWLRSAAPRALLLHARHDYRFPVADTAGLADGRRIQRVVLEDAGHLAPLEQPEPWCAAVTAFLDAG